MERIVRQDGFADVRYSQECDILCTLCRSAGCVVSDIRANPDGTTNFYCKKNGGEPIASINVRNYNDPMQRAQAVSAAAEQRALDDARPKGRTEALGSHYDTHR